MIEIDAHEWDAGGPGEPPGAIMVSKGVDAALGEEADTPAGRSRSQGAQHRTKTLAAAWLHGDHGATCDGADGE